MTTTTTATHEIEKLRAQVAGRERHIETLHAEIGRLRIHVEGLQNTADDYLGEKQQLGEWLAKAEAERCTGRCAAVTDLTPVDRSSVNLPATRDTH